MIGFESVRIPFDINVEAEALGCTLDWERNKVQPVILQRPALKFDDGLGTVPDPKKEGRMPLVLEAARILAAKGEGKLPVIVGALGPLNIAVQLKGAESFLMDLLLQPEESHRLLDFCWEVAASYMRALNEVADVVTVVDATSSPDLIGPEEFRVFSKSRLSALVEKAEVSTILHICGRTQPILRDMASIGFDAISIDSVVDMGDAKAACEKRCSVLGNVSAIGSLLLGTPDEVREETREAILRGSDVPCTSCGIAPGTCTENLQALVRAVHRYGRRIE